MSSPVIDFLIHAKVADIVDPPRSWGKQEKLMFLQLPRPLQLYYDKREKERDLVVRRAQAESFKAREELAAVKTELAACKAKLAKIEDKNVEAENVAA